MAIEYEQGCKVKVKHGLPVDYEMRWACDSFNGGTWVRAKGEATLGRTLR